MDDQSITDPRARAHHEMKYYANLLADSQAMAEFVAETQRPRHIEDDGGRDLQIEISRQNVTFSNCLFHDNTYGAADGDGFTNYGAITAKTPDNDLAVRNCVFSENEFGIASIVVRSCMVLGE